MLYLFYTMQFKFFQSYYTIIVSSILEHLFCLFYHSRMNKILETSRTWLNDYSESLISSDPDLAFFTLTKCIFTASGSCTCRCGIVLPRCTSSAGPHAPGPPSMSTSQSPPRKRVRSNTTSTRSTPSSSMINDDGAPSNFDGSNQLSPPPVGNLNSGARTRKMRLQKNRNRQRSSNNGASIDEPILGDVAPNIVPGSDDENNDISSSDESCLSSALIRKVKRRSGHLSSTDHEIVRLIGQHLTNIGLRTSADVLMQEAGCRLDQPTAATFKKFVLGGDWSAAVRSNYAQRKLY